MRFDNKRRKPSGLQVFLSFIEYGKFGINFVEPQRGSPEQRISNLFTTSLFFL
jgi:hypothetical protein